MTQAALLRLTSGDKTPADGQQQPRLSDSMLWSAPQEIETLAERKMLWRAVEVASPLELPVEGRRA